MENNIHDILIPKTSDSAQPASAPSVPSQPAFPWKSSIITAGIALTFGCAGGAIVLAFGDDIQHRFSASFLKSSHDAKTLSAVSQEAPSVKDDGSDDVIVSTVEKSSPAVVSVVITQDVPKLQRGMGVFGFPFFMMPQQNTQDDGAADDK